jgi:hypothetical protein
MFNPIASEYDELSHLTNKELAKRLKKTLKLLQTKRREAKDISDVEQLYWGLQRERLKRVYGKNY